MRRFYALISQFFSFETLLVLYLFAGIYKADETLRHYSNIVDLTLFFFLATIFVGIAIIIKQGIKFEKDTTNLLFTFAIFIIYAGLSLSWSQSSQYGVTKALYLGVLNFWNLICACLIIAPDTQRIRRFMFLLLCFSLIYAAISLPLVMDVGRDQTIELTGSDYKGTAFIFCIALLALICYVIDSSQPKFLRVTCFIISCIYFWILLFVGDRGYFLGSILAMIVLFFANPLPAALRRKIYFYKRYIFLLLIFFVCMIFVLEVIDRTPATLSRLSVLSESGSENGSALYRLKLYKAGLEIWNNNLILGSGIGSFPVIMGGGDKREYPHNLVIELLSELGLVGLGLYSLFLFSAVKLIFKINRPDDYPLPMFILLLFILSLFDALVSGDISDHRWLIVALGLMVMPKKASQPVHDTLADKMAIVPGLGPVKAR